MLAALNVRDIVLIEKATLEFAPGLNVLTGETGAGKSILLDALGLACGGRGSGRASVRVGAAQGAVSAEFEVPKGHPVWPLLAEQAMDGEDGLILRRTVYADGRTRGFVNDESAGISLMKRLGDLLLEVHGQSDDRGLFDTSTHRGLLDAFGGYDDLLAGTASRFAAYHAAETSWKSLLAEQKAAAADAAFLQAAVGELSALDVRPGEEAELAAERALLMNAARVGEDCSAAVELLAGEMGAESLLSKASGKVGRLSAEARTLLTGAESALEAASASAEEARRELEAFLSRLDADSGELERKEERLFAIRAAARKYGKAADELPELLEAFSARCDLIDTGSARVREAEAAVGVAKEAYLAAGRKLTAARRAAAKKLEAAVAGELKPLKLGHARFRVAFVPLETGTEAGLEKVAFEVATIEGAAFGPLTKIASGGELARFSLALKVALAEESPLTALVFDEVDRGVGGAVADAVGERLQRLARKTQVLLVTHSPQVAARAERHFRITRAKDKTRVEMLDEAARREEVARMLSGATVTGEARAAADRLIAEAKTAKASAAKSSRSRK